MHFYLVNAAWLLNSSPHRRWHMLCCKCLKSGLPVHSCHLRINYPWLGLIMRISNLLVPVSFIISSSTASTHTQEPPGIFTSEHMFVSRTHSANGEVHSEEHVNEKIVKGSHKTEKERSVKDGVGEERIVTCNGDECHQEVKKINIPTQHVISGRTEVPQLLHPQYV